MDACPSMAGLRRGLPWGVPTGAITVPGAPAPPPSGVRGVAVVPPDENGTDTRGPKVPPLTRTRSEREVVVVTKPAFRWFLIRSGRGGMRYRHGAPD